MGNVIIYSMPSCIYCIKAKKLLNTHGIEYEEIDVSKEKNREELHDMGCTTVPMLVIDGLLIRGFNEQKILNALMTQKS